MTTHERLAIAIGVVSGYYLPGTGWIHPIAANTCRIGVDAVLCELMWPTAKMLVVASNTMHEPDTVELEGAWQQMIDMVLSESTADRGE